MLIETERTRIRHFKADDFHDLFEILSDPMVMENTEPPYDAEKCRAFLDDFCVEKKKGLAVVHKQADKVIGYVLFAPYGEADVYEIGWIFNKAYWRQGYAFEAIGALLKFAFLELNTHKVFAEAIDAVKSVKLMEKLGMKWEGVQRQQTRDNDGAWRDLYFYGLLREEYTDRQV